METLRTAIEFVSRGTKHNSDDGGLLTSLAATGDFSWIGILFLFILIVCALLAFIYAIKKLNSKTVSAIEGTATKSKIFAIASAILIFIACFAVVFYTSFQKAMADSQIKVSDKIQAVVDYDTSSVSIDTAKIQDNSLDDTTSYIKSVNVVSENSFADCNWTIMIGDKRLYNDSVNHKNKITEAISVPKDEQEITISSDISFDVAEGFVGQCPVSIEYDIEKDYMIKGKISLNTNENENIDGGTASFVRAEDGVWLDPVSINADGTYVLLVPAGEVGHISYRANNFVPIDTEDFTVDKDIELKQDAELSCNLYGELVDSDGNKINTAIVEMPLGEPKPGQRSFRSDVKEDGSFLLQVPRNSTDPGEFRVYDYSQQYVFPYIIVTANDMEQASKKLEVETLKIVTLPTLNEVLEYNGEEQTGVIYDSNMFVQSGDSASATVKGNYKTTLTPKENFGWSSPDGYETKEKLTESREYNWSIVSPSAKLTKAPFPIRDLTATGNPIKIAENGEAVNGTMKYAVTNSVDEPSDTEWKDSLDTKSAVGTYYVHYYAKGNEGFEDSPKAYIRVSIYTKLLKDYSWEELKNIAQDISEGTSNPEFEAMALDGMTKPVQLTDTEKFAGGDVLEYRIIGINHDEKTDGGIAGLTFMPANCINWGFCAGNKGDETSTFASWWGESPLRKRMQQDGDVYKMMPTDLTNVISKVKKSSLEGWKNEEKFSETLKTSEDYFFIPSGSELGADLFGNEGSTYEYAKNDPWQLYWSSFGTGPSDNTLNHTGFLYLKEHQAEISSPMDAHEDAYNHGGVVKVPGDPDQDIEYEYFSWLRSPFSDNPHDQGCLYYSGNVNNVGWVNYQATLTPCFCL